VARVGLGCLALHCAVTGEGLMLRVDRLVRGGTCWRLLHAGCWVCLADAYSGSITVEHVCLDAFEHLACR
jgi:hypothetical protein